MAKKEQAPVAENTNLPARQNEVVTALGVPNELADLVMQDVGRGFTHTQADDFALPFLQLLQSLSPQVNSRDPKYVPGAQAGMWFNTVTQELWDGEQGIAIIPVEYVKVYNEWIPRDKGGGFIKMHTDKQQAEIEKRQDTQVVDTANFFALARSKDSSWTPVVLSMTSTKLKVARSWMSIMDGYKLPKPGGGKETAPMFSRWYVLKTVQTRNDKGTFFIPQVIDQGKDGWVVDRELYLRARQLYDQVSRGARGVDFRRQEQDEVVEVQVEEADLPNM